jgi:iron complex outermembrane recepter protein
MKKAPNLKKNMLHATALISSFACSVPTMAQDVEDDFHNDAEIVVTAPLGERLDLLTGTSTVSGEKLASEARAQIGDTLASLPGISATSFSPGASRPVLRGFQGNRVAVLTDGIGNIDASNTSADHAVTIESVTTERIEVLRGPAVLLFGGQAVGGAVNAIDKRIPRAVPKEPIHIDAIANIGSAANETALASSVDLPISGQFVVHADGSFRDSGDLRTGGPILTDALRAQTLAQAVVEDAEGNADSAVNLRRFASLSGQLPNSAVHSWTAGLGASLINEGGNLGISYGIYDSLYGVPTRPASNAENVVIDLRQYRSDLRSEVQTGNGFIEKIRLRAGFADYTHAEIEGGAIGTRFVSQGIEARFELAQNNRGGWKGASGAQFQTRKLNAIGAEAFIPPNRNSQLGIFTFQELPLGPLQLEAALRYDMVSLAAPSVGLARDFGNISAALGASGLIGQFKLGINVSRTGRAPSAEELFSNGPHLATQAFEVGDPNLTSERSWNGEIYARLESATVKLSATGYSNWFNGYIYDSATGNQIDGLPEFSVQQRNAHYWGAEFEVSSKLASIGSFEIMANGVGDFVHAKLGSNGGYVPRIPPLRLHGGLAMNSPHFDVGGEIEWVDKQNRVAANETSTMGFTVANANAAWRPWGKERNITLIANVNNIFDVNVRRAASFTKDFAPLAGRDFRLTARFSL